jgi:hypothetical protein
VCDEKFEDERGLEGKTGKIDSEKREESLEKIHHRHRRIVMNEMSKVFIVRVHLVKTSCTTLRLVQKQFSVFCTTIHNQSENRRCRTQRRRERETSFWSFQSVNKICLITKAISVQCNENFHVITMTEMNKQEQEKCTLSGD